MILLDPGHGSNTKGKRSPVWPDGSQLFEWEFNRDVCRRIQSRLARMNIDSQIIVKEAIDVPLKIRADRANAVYLKDPSSFLISVHANAGGGQGWEIWTSPDETESDKIATIIYTTAQAMLPQFRMRHDYSDGDPDKESRFYMLTKTKCPAVLSENLFYDNEIECRFLMSDYGREIIGKIHSIAIQSYLRLRQ